MLVIVVESRDTILKFRTEHKNETENEREMDNFWRNKARFLVIKSERSTLTLCTVNGERPRIFQIRTSLRGRCMKPQNLRMKIISCTSHRVCESNDLRSNLLRDLPNKFHFITDINTIHLL